MALNFPSSPTNLQQYSDPNGIVWEYTSAKGVWRPLTTNELKEFSGAKIEFTTTKTLTSTSSAISWDSSEFDTGTYFNISTPSKINITKAGYYRLNVTIQTGTQGNGASYNLVVKKNGTTNLVSDTAGPNQGVIYDEVFEFFTGDYLELHADETGAVGTLTTNSYFEIERIGYALGSSFSPMGAFSGVKLELSTAESMTSTLTGITWDSAEYNINADINGNTYWSLSDTTKVNISTTGYYRVKSVLKTGTAGTTDSYTLDLKLNGLTLTSGSLSPNDLFQLDEVYNFTSSSYLQIYAKNTGAVGTITTDSYFQVIRMGV
jgi:hypothetical protein